MEQGRIIEQYATANIVERPGAERHLYQVTKATKSPQYGSLKPLLDDDNLEEIMYNHPEKPIMVAHRKHRKYVNNVKMSSDESTTNKKKIAKAHLGIGTIGRIFHLVEEKKIHMNLTLIHI